MAEKLCDKSCDGCIHLSHFYDDLTCCNYFISTGERRPCPPVRAAPSEKPSGRGRKETLMEASKLIETLRFCGDKESCCSQCPSGDRVTEYTATECMCDLMQKAADTIEALQAELRDEMRRHDRPQDFEVAEAQDLALVKAERDAMEAELKHDQGCDGCVHCDTEWCEEPCDSCRQDPKFPAWKWRGRS